MNNYFSGGSDTAQSEALLVGDLTDASSTNDRILPGATFLPGFGDITDLLHVGQGDVTDYGAIALEGMGDIVKAATMSPLPGLPRVPSSLGAPKPGTSTTLVGASPSLSAQQVGLLSARAALMRGGLNSKGEQDAIIRAAATAQNLSELGKLVNGGYGRNSILPFFSLGRGQLTSVNTLRRGAGFKASSLGWHLMKQEAVYPYKEFAASLAPTSGTPFYFTAGLPADQNVPVTAILLKLSANPLTANRTKLFTINLSYSTGAGPVRNIYGAKVSYDEFGMATMMFYPAQQIDGDWFLTEKTALNSTTPALVENVGFTITGCDGVNDWATALLLGPGNEYIASLRSNITM